MTPENRPAGPGEEPGFAITMGGIVVFTVTHDGRIVRGPRFATDDAASCSFLEALATITPTFIQELAARAQWADAWRQRAMHAEAEIAKWKEILN